MSRELRIWSLYGFLSHILSTGTHTQKGSAFGLIFSCCHLEILNNLWTRGPIFSFCTDPCKLCSWSWLSTVPGYFPQSEFIRLFSEQREEIPITELKGRRMMKERGPPVVKTTKTHFPISKLYAFFFVILTQGHA